MHPVVELAKKTIEEHVRYGKVTPAPGDMTPEMKEKAGVFVSIKKHGRLRGCIGTFMPITANVAEETIRNAIAAATEDPRFNAVEENELKDLTYSVDILTQPEKVANINMLDHKKYGVIVARGNRKGLLLPDLEGVDTAEEQFRIARMKAGIGMDEVVEIFRFEVKRYH